MINLDLVKRFNREIIVPATTLFVAFWCYAGAFRTLYDSYMTSNYDGTPWTVVLVALGWIILTKKDYYS